MWTFSLKLEGPCRISRINLRAWSGRMAGFGSLKRMAFGRRLWGSITIPIHWTLGYLEYLGYNGTGGLQLLVLQSPWLHEVIHARLSHLQMSETSEPTGTWKVTTDSYSQWTLAMDSVGLSQMALMWFTWSPINSQKWHISFLPLPISMPNLMKLHRIPLIHDTDCGLTFMANFTKNIYKELRIKPWFSTVYHPQTQGQVEK